MVRGVYFEFFVESSFRGPFLPQKFGYVLRPKPLLSVFGGLRDSSSYFGAGSAIRARTCLSTSLEGLPRSASN